LQDENDNLKNTIQQLEEEHQELNYRLSEVQREKEQQKEEFQERLDLEKEKLGSMASVS
jgi:uncharacterized protein YlxW (UPF0749 family)